MRDQTTEISINGRVLVGITRAEYRRLSEGASARTEALRTQLESAREAHAKAIDVRDELKRSLDDALSQIERLSDDRDHWQQEAENQGKETELWKSLAQRQDNTAPLRLKTRDLERERDDAVRARRSAEESAAHCRARYGLDESVDELRATIVRQAREITRLTEESE